MSFWDRYAANPPRRTALQEIAENLRNVLSSRRGFGSVRSDFGLGSFFAKVGSRDMVLALRDEILEAVEQNEPRLAEPTLEVRGRDTAQGLLFELRGMVQGKPQRLYIRFDMTLFEVSVEALG